MPPGAGGIAIAGIFPLWLIAVVAIRNDEDLGGLALWPLVLSWGLMMRHRVGHRLAWSLGAAAAVGCVTPLLVLPHVGTPVAGLIGLSGWPLLVWAVMWGGASRREIGAMVLFLAMVPMVPACVLTWDAAHAYVEGHYWTKWDCSIFSERRDAAMNRREAFRAGIVLGVTAALAGAVGTYLRWGGRGGAGGGAA